MCVIESWPPKIKGGSLHRLQQAISFQRTFSITKVVRMLRLWCSIIALIFKLGRMLGPLQMCSLVLKVSPSLAMLTTSHKARSISKLCIRSLTLPDSHPSKKLGVSHPRLWLSKPPIWQLCQQKDLVELGVHFLPSILSRHRKLRQMARPVSIKEHLG